MAKTKAKAKSFRIEGIEDFELVYDLEELPSVQHRAGLAGLYVLLSYLEGKQLMSKSRFDLETPRRLRLKVGTEDLAALLTSLYSPMEVERSHFEEKKDFSYHREELGRHYYRVRRPEGAWWNHFGLGSAWIDQWQDTVWSYLRVKPTTRKIFDKTREQWLTECEALFRELRDDSKAIPLTHQLYIGSAALDTERVAFTTTPRLAFLLEFAQVVLRVYPFQISKLDKKTRSRVEHEQQGKVLVFQEPERLDLFLEGFKSGLWRCSDNDRFPRSGYVSLPTEAGLDCFTEVLEPTVAGGLPVPFLRSVLCYHIELVGTTSKDAKVRQVESLKWNSRFVHVQALVRELWHPLLKRQALLTGLKDQAFYHNAHLLCETEDSHFFVGRGSEVAKWFALDCEKLFKRLPRERTEMTEHLAHGVEIADDDAEPCVATQGDRPQKTSVTWEIVVKRLVLNYVQGRCLSRLNLRTREELAAQPVAKIEKHWENVYSDLFFKLRSARNQERFAEVFTSVLVGARDPYGILREPAFQELSNMLTGPRWTTLKSVTFLALGAASRYVPLNKKSPQEGAKHEK